VTVDTDVTEVVLTEGVASSDDIVVLESPGEIDS